MSKRQKTFDINNCISVYTSTFKVVDLCRYITKHVKNHHDRIVNPITKRNVIKILCSSQSDFEASYTTLKDQNVQNNAPVKYIVVPAGQAPTEHTVKFHSKNELEILKKLKFLIETNPQLVITHMHLKQIKESKLHKLRVSVATQKEKETLTKNDFDVWQPIEQIIRDTRLEATCTFQDELTDEELKQLIYETATNAQVEFEDSRLQIIKKLSDKRINGHYYIVNYRCKNEKELEALTKETMVCAGAKGLKPVWRRFMSTAEYLTNKFLSNTKSVKKDEKPATAEMVNMVWKKLEDHDQKFQTLMESIGEIKKIMEDKFAKVDKRLHDIEGDQYGEDDNYSYSKHPHDITGIKSLTLIIKIKHTSPIGN